MQRLVNSWFSYMPLKIAIQCLSLKSMWQVCVTQAGHVVLCHVLMLDRFLYCAFEMQTCIRRLWNLLSFAIQHWNQDSRAGNRSRVYRAKCDLFSWYASLCAAVVKPGVKNSPPSLKPRTVCETVSLFSCINVKKRLRMKYATLIT